MDVAVDKVLKKPQFVFGWYPDGNLEGEPEDVIMLNVNDEEKAVAMFTSGIVTPTFLKKIRLIQVIE